MKPFNMDAFRENLRECRLQAGLTMQQLADKINVRYLSIYRWETGKRSPALVHVVAIAEALDMSLPELLGIADEEEDNGY